MVTYVLSGKPKAGKDNEAVAWAKDEAKRVQKIGGVPISVLRRRFSDDPRIYWVINFETLAALEAWEKKIHANKAHGASVKKAFLTVIEDGAGALYQEA